MGVKLTPRGERVLVALGLVTFFLAYGFMGWIEMGMP